MSEWVRITTLNELPPGSSREFEYEGRIIALFHLDEQIYAIDGICPHQGGPLAEGECNGTIVTCPWHGWQFDVRNGQSPTFKSIRHPVYDVKLENDDIMIQIE